MCVLLFCAAEIVNAQQSVEAIRKEATVFAQQEKFGDAIHVLDQGLQQYPNNLDILKMKLT